MGAELASHPSCDHPMRRPMMFVICSVQVEVKLSVGATDRQYR